MGLVGAWSSQFPGRAWCVVRRTPDFSPVASWRTLDRIAPQVQEVSEVAQCVQQAREELRPHYEAELARRSRLHGLKPSHGTVFGEGAARFEAMAKAKLGTADDLGTLAQELAELRHVHELPGISLDKWFVMTRTGEQERKHVMSVYCPWRAEMVSVHGVAMFDGAVEYHCAQELQSPSNRLGAAGFPEDKWIAEETCRRALGSWCP